MSKTLNHRPILWPAVWTLICISPNILAYDGEKKTEEFGVVVQAASDWIYDGTTETRGEPSIGINGEWRAQPALFLGFEAHEANVRADRQRQRSISAYIGIDQSLGENWYTALSLQHREFPGSIKEWDFTEVILQFAYLDNVSLSLDYSPNYYARGTKGFGGVLSYTRNISRRTYWSAEVGSQQLSESRFVDYEYARLALGLSTSKLNIDISYGWNSEDGNLLFGNEPLLSPELLLQVSYRIK